MRFCVKGGKLSQDLLNYQSFRMKVTEPEFDLSEFQWFSINDPKLSYGLLNHQSFCMKGTEPLCNRLNYQPFRTKVIESL